MSSSISSSRRHRHSWFAVIFAFSLMASVIWAPPASAHAELREASPAQNQTVGGSIHSIAMQFSELDPVAPQSAWLVDPAGQSIGGPVVREGPKVIIPVEPLTIPGDYTVVFEVNGSDGDFSRGEYTFRYDPAAPEPAGLLLDLSPDDGFDWFFFGLLMAGAAVAAFLVHRFLTALRDHRAAAATVDVGTDG